MLHARSLVGGCDVSGDRSGYLEMLELGGELRPVFDKTVRSSKLQLRTPGDTLSRLIAEMKHDIALS